MPGQRSKKKIRFGGYMDRKTYQSIVALARREGKEQDLFAFMQKLIRKAISDLERKRDGAED